MAKITIEINTDNDAFQDDYNGVIELRRLLNELSTGLFHRHYLLAEDNHNKLYDVNGNICGFIKIENED